MQKTMQPTIEQSNQQAIEDFFFCSNYKPAETKQKMLKFIFEMTTLFAQQEGLDEDYKIEYLGNFELFYSLVSGLNPTGNDIVNNPTSLN